MSGSKLDLLHNTSCSFQALSKTLENISLVLCVFLPRIALPCPHIAEKSIRDARLQANRGVVQADPMDEGESYTDDSSNKKRNQLATDPHAWQTGDAYGPVRGSTSDPTPGSSEAHSAGIDCDTDGPHSILTKMLSKFRTGQDVVSNDRDVGMDTTAQGELDSSGLVGADAAVDESYQAMTEFYSSLFFASGEAGKIDGVAGGVDLDAGDIEAVSEFMNSVVSSTFDTGESLTTDVGGFHVGDMHFGGLDFSGLDFSGLDFGGGMDFGGGD